MSVHETAQKYLAEENPLAYHAGVWWEHTGTRYREVPPEYLDAMLRLWLHSCGFEPKPATVANLMAQIRAMSFVEPGSPMPCWRTEAGPDPANVVAYRNGLLDTAAWLKGGRELMPHTPQWFSASCLPYDYEPQADCPRWREFLRQSLADQEQAALLQEWFGYCLTHDNQFQKLLFLLGPKRSGKSTTLEVLSRLVGDDAAFGGTLQGLAGEFGLWPLIGKQVVTTSEIHLGGQEGKKVVQVLKNIVGGNRMAINRKGLSIVSMPLPVRITLAANQLPRLPDDSNALAARMLLLHYPHSFLGKEDVGLAAKLAAELPGIANWALDGLRRLHGRGCFIQPDYGREFLDEFENLWAPVEEFLADYCQEGDGLWELSEYLYYAWQEFCHGGGYEAEPQHLRCEDQGRTAENPQYPDSDRRWQGPHLSRRAVDQERRRPPGRQAHGRRLQEGPQGVRTKAHRGARRCSGLRLFVSGWA